MIYKITHRLKYQYSAPVYFEPHYLHLKPRSDESQTLRQFTLRVNPEPFHMTELNDALGNPAHEIWFDGAAECLVMEASSITDVTRSNPFDYILRTSALHLPVNYSSSLISYLKPFLNTDKVEASVREFSSLAAKKAGFETVGFLSQLCLMMNRQIQPVHREEGFPWLPEKTLSGGTGACRDMAVLFIACCRAQGLAARFTSGYAYETWNKEGTDLHAWAEVYLEGAGWRGYDPSTGLAVSDQHIAVASAPEPQLVSPVTGTFRADKIISSLETCISVEMISEKDVCKSLQTAK